MQNRSCYKKLFLYVWMVILIAEAYCAKQQYQPLLSDKILKAAEFELIWDTKLPVKQNESLDHLYVIKDNIYLVTNYNYLTAANRHTGNIAFGLYIAYPGFPFLSLESFNDKLFTLIGSEFIEIDTSLGTKSVKARLEVRPVCPVVKNDEFIYAAGVDGRIDVFDAEKMVRLFEVAPENDSMITSLIASNDNVVFSTDAGDLVSFMPDRRNKLWHFKAAEGIVGPIVSDGTSVFAASKDTNLYNIDRGTGRMKWKYQTAGILDTSPRVTADVVYQYVKNHGMIAIDKFSGDQIWHLPTGMDLLAEVKNRAYIFTSDHKIAVMDNTKARPLYFMNCSLVNRYAVNMLDSKIYLADRTGRVICIKPMEW